MISGSNSAFSLMSVHGCLLWVLSFLPFSYKEGMSERGKSLEQEVDLLGVGTQVRRNILFL